MREKRTYIKNAYIISMNDDKQVFENGGVLIVDDKIKAVGKIDEKEIFPDTKIIDAKGKIVMPGLINTHVHTSQQLERGMGDDVDLLTWLTDRTFPYESSMTPEDSYVSTLLCLVEQIRSGVTTIAEPGGQFVPSMCKAVAQSGIRGILAKSSMDYGDNLPPVWRRSTQEELDVQEQDLKDWNNTYDGRVKVWFGLRTLFNDSDKLVLGTKELADKYNVGIHMHVAEAKAEVEYVKETKGVPTVTHLRNLGVLDKNLLAVHTVWLTDEEVDMFKEYDVKVSHNPASAMRVLGFAKIPKMLKKGICVSIGTDGASANNRMTMIDEMYVTSLIHKGWRLDPTVVKAEEIITMATTNGAKALLWEDEIGALKPGMKADLIIINPDSAAMLPIHDPIANIVTAMHESNVESVMCNGEWVMKDRIILTLDEQAILEEAKIHAEAIRKRAGIVLPDRFPVVKC